MNQAGIPKKRQAAPQAPPRDFKPRKNGAPAVPATPPANMPGQAFAPQQPPMRGAAQSMAPQRAPQRAMRRAQGRFNPMQGPMGTGMGRARQAAATMFMDRAPQQMQPGMPQQSKGQQQAAMGAPAKQAPKRNQAASQPSFSAGQKAALDLAGMGPMMAMSGQAPGGSGEGMLPTGEAADSGQQSFGSVMDRTLGISATPEDAVAAGEPVATETSGQGTETPEKAEEAATDETDFDEFAEAAALLAQAQAGTGYDVDGDGQADVFLGPGGDLVDSEGTVVAEDFFGSAPKGEKGPDFSPKGVERQKIIQSLIDQGIISPDADPATASAVLQALREELMDLLGSENEGFFTDEELAAQGTQIKAQAQQAASNLAQQMAMRGMGASGLAGVGFGDIAATELSELTDLAVQNKIAGDEARRANMAALGSLLTGLQSDETRKELFKMGEEARRSEQEVADSWNFLNNELGLSQGDKWDTSSKADVLEALANGVPVYEVMRGITYDTQKDPATGDMINVAVYNPPEPKPDGESSDEASVGSASPFSADMTESEWMQTWGGLSSEQKQQEFGMIVDSYENNPPPGVAPEDFMAMSDQDKFSSWINFWTSNGVPWLAYLSAYQEEKGEPTLTDSIEAAAKAFAQGVTGAFGQATGN